MSTQVRAEAARTRPDTAWAAWLAASITIVAPQLLGGATPNTRACVLVLAVTLSLTTAFVCRAKNRPIGAVPWAVWGAAFAALWTLLQAVPLPCALVDAAWPARSTFADQLAQAGISGAPRCTLSRAPAATWSAFALAICLCSVLASSTALSRLGHRRLLAKSVLWSSLTMAAVALSHAVADAGKVFGIYAPQHARPGLLLAPLLNGNHLAALLGLGLPIAVWEFQTNQRAEQRVLWAGACLGLGATIVLTLSRSGLLAGLVATGLYLTAPETADDDDPQTSRKSLKRWFLVGSSIVAFVALASYGADLVAREFGDSISLYAKAGLILKFLALAAQHPWLGVGRGAFGDVSVALAPSTAHAMHAENVLAHWFVEWGVPASLLVLGSILSTAIGLKRQRGLTYAVACGLLGLLVHDVADFALELPGIAIPAAIALGTLLYSRAPTARNRWAGYRLKPLLAPAAVAAAGALGITWPLQTTRSRAATHEKLAVFLANNSRAFETALSEALPLYPLDPTLYVLAAGHAVRERPTLAARWLNLAMAQAPGWANPHLQASYWLESQGRIEQAAIEMGIAIEGDLHGTLPSACMLLVRHPSARLAWLIAPEGSSGQIVVEQLAHCIRWIERVEIVSELLVQALERYPDSLAIREQWVRALSRQKLLVEAVAAARQLERLAPDYAPGVAGLIRALSDTGDSEAAWRAYLAASRQVRRDRNVLRVAIEPLVRLRDLKNLREVLDTLQAQSQNAEDEANLASIAGEAYAAAGDAGRALGVLQSAYRRHRNPALLERIHQLASTAGLGDVALRAALELCHLGHRGAAFCEDAQH